MAVVFSNNAKTTLASTVSTSATSITVADGSVFPALNGSDYTYVTFEDTSGNVEIVKVTALSGNTLTVVRAQDNTSARAFSSGDKCELRLTSAGLNDVTTTTTTTASVTAAGALMDSEISNIEAIKTLNQSVRTVDSVNFGAVNTTGDIETGSKLIFGTHDSELGNNYLQFNANSHAFIGHNVVGKTLSFKISVAAPLDTTPFTLTQYGMTINGTMATTGSITGGGTIKTGNDTGKIMLGTSNDLQIYHDGNHSHLRNATGDLRIRSDGFKIQNYGANSSYMTGVNGGAVSLYFAGVSKVTTTANGVTVTGSLSAAGGSSTNWNAAYGWGNHASAGYLTSYTDTNTTYSIQDGELSQNNFTNADHTKLNGIAVNANNYTLPFTDNSTNWNTAYTYSQVGHLPLAGGTLTGNLLINSANAEVNLRSGVAGTSGAVNWTFNTNGTNYASIKLPYDTRASTGLHIDSGYPITIDTSSSAGIKFVVNAANKATINSSGLTVSGTVSATGGNSTNWNTAYGWGNHASAGYVPTSGGTVTTSSNAWGKVQNTTATGYSEFAIANSSDQKLIMGSIGPSYTNADWAGSRYIYNSAGNLRIKSVGNLQFYSGGTSHTTNLALDFATNRIGSFSVTPTVAGSSVWHAGNDGSGSGLDADLLDGLHATSFASSTFNVASGASNSDPNSRTDAYFLTNSANAAFGSLFSHIQNHWWSSVGGNVAQHATTYNGSTARFAVRHRYSGSWTSWAQAWTQVNDGSGSGLDADTVDGIQGASLLRSDAADTFTSLTGTTLTASKHICVAGTDNGIGFWGSTSNYAIQMGNNQANHGTVTDYSMHHNMGTSAGRGFTFGNSRTSVKCSINAATGAILSSNNITAYSDIRVKDNIEVIPNALDKVSQLSGYTFTRTDVDDKEQKYTGVIAQEVLEVLPEAVQLGATEEDTMSVAYGNMVGLLIESIKELKAEVDDLKTQLENK